MRGDFDYVVCGVRMGIGKVCDNGLINSLLGLRFHQLCKHRPPRLQGTAEVQHGLRKLLCLGAGKPYYADTSSSRRSRDGDNGVVKVHVFIVENALSWTPAQASVGRLSE